MVLLAILSGVVIICVWRRHIPYWAATVLIAWGLLAATTKIGATPAGWLNSLSGLLQSWF